MNSREKIDRATNTARLCLYKEGIFYKLYNQHAMLFVQNIKPLKVTAKFVKVVNQHVYSVGFPGVPPAAMREGLCYIRDVTKMKMFYKTLFTGLLIIFSGIVTNNFAWATFTISAQTTVNIELTGYEGLTDSSLFKGSVAAGGSREIDTLYRGLALLICADGQRYPVIIGDEYFTLKINNPAEPPSFTGGRENEFFYKMLSGGELEGQPYSFALLMIQAKQLLESSHSVRSVSELTAKKKEYHDLVRDHYQSLKHSDMIRQLLGQYFMMHEYVDYHLAGAQASGIKIKYHQAVLDGVENWLAILRSHIPEHEILNYCVSLYYNRSMVALASLIIENFRAIAYCPGEEGKTILFPEDLRITDAQGKRETRLSTFNGEKIIAVVSDDCPVSMVETVSKARQLVEQKEDVTLIVAPLQELSEEHLAMNRLVSGGDILFVDDERWPQGKVVKKMRLPLFHRIGASPN
jgi:hypothetical protein